MRPLDRIPSIKVKFGIVIVTAVAVATVASMIGLHLGWPIWVRPIVAAVVSLTMVQVLAKGMTRPLREMEAAASTMARGDLTERIETEATDEVGRLARAFNTMADELAETDRQRRELIANVSHELRTPIAALQATIENLLDGVSAADAATLTSMHEQTERLAHLVRDLLELSRLESGASTLDLFDVDLVPLARGVVDDARLVHPGVTIELVAIGPATVEADQRRLHQVMTNLVNNAARHGGGTPVTVTVTKGQAGGSFAVSDRGCGIPDHERDRVFERFQQLDPSRVRGDGGAGLGLPVAHWIVELHHGRIEVSDAKGGGCCMTVELPRFQPGHRPRLHAGER